MDSEIVLKTASPLSRSIASQPEVTFLIPVGPAREPWCGDALRSAIEQDAVNSQVVAVLDQRTRPPESVGDLAQHPKIRWISNLRSPGVAGALNTGLNAVETEFVARLDCDDQAFRYRAALQIEALARTGCAISCGESISVRGSEACPEQVLGEIVHVTQLSAGSLMFRNSVIHSTVVMRRDHVLRAGGYSENIGKLEDYELWLRLASLGPIAQLATPVGFRRLHPDQHSSHGRTYSDFASLLAPKLKLSKKRYASSVPGLIGHAYFFSEHASRSLKQRAKKAYEVVRRW